MSHHIRSHLRTTFPPRRLYPPKAKDPLLYLLCTPRSHHQRLLLGIIGTMTLRPSPCRPSQARLAEMLGRCRETVNRNLGALKQRGLIRLVRRGHGLTNVYLLARWLWRALTWGPARYDRERQYQLDFQTGLEQGLSPPRAILAMLDSGGGG